MTVKDTWTTELDVVPVVEERATACVAIRETARVRVKKTVTSRDVTLDAKEAQEQLTIERIMVERDVNGPLPVRQEGNVIIVPVVDEVAVVSKRYVLREEVRITRTRVESVRPMRTTLRREDVTTERTPAALPREPKSEGEKP